MKARDPHATHVRFGQLHVHTRAGGVDARADGASFGRKRADTSLMSSEQRKRRRLRDPHATAAKPRNRFAALLHQRRPNAKQRHQLASNLVKGQLRQTFKPVGEQDDTDPMQELQQSMQSHAIRATKRGATRAGKTAGRAGLKAAGTAGKATGKAAAKGAKATVQATARVAQQATVAASHAVAALGAAVSTASMPIIAIIATVVAIVVMVVSMFSWLPGFANQNQNAATATGSTFPITDDYPYKGHYNDGTSPLGYEYGNCTDFAAWRVNRDNGVGAAPWKYKWAQLTPNGGNGGQWGNLGNLPGWAVTTDPQPGDLISIPAGVALLGASGGPYGHVGYIAQVANNVVTIENYGHGKYFLTSPTTAQLAQYITAHQAIVKHNPLGRKSSGNASGNATDAKAYAQQALHDDAQYQCLVQLWDHESGWRVNAQNAASGAYGIPQALPGTKMASQGADWKTNGITQVKWGLDYIQHQRPDYGNPCTAWSKWQSRSPHWY